MSVTNNNNNKLMVEGFLNETGDITITLLGNTMLGREYAKDDGYFRNTFDPKFRTHSMETVYDKFLLKNYLRNSNLVIGNLESPITSCCEPVNKKHTWRIRQANMGFLNGI